MNEHITLLSKLSTKAGTFNRTYGKLGCFAYILYPITKSQSKTTLWFMNYNGNGIQNLTTEELKHLSNGMDVFILSRRVYLICDSLSNYGLDFYTQDSEEPCFTLERANTSSNFEGGFVK